MNKADAKVYKALAECGFEAGKEIPDPQVDMDSMFKILLDENAIFLEEVEILFSGDEKKIVTTREKLNSSLKPAIPTEIITK